ncbi:hypothetical protein PFMC_01986, partial [Plasmodium falciparum CAMP/Malaysia]
MVTPGGGQVGGDGIEHDKDAKHLLDSIGKKVHDEIVKKEADGTAKNYIGDLKGNLTISTIFDTETTGSLDPCELQSEYTKLINGGGGKRHPCANRSKIRFSDESRSQCTFNRIKDSQQGDNKGACAPYRRLSVCDRNLELMKPKKRKARHNLLAEVCMAAKYEAESLINYREQYEAEHHDTGFTTCTMLARSFADIGDIIRGKDLYLGNPQESAQRDKLEENLKTIFGHIYEELKKDRKNGAEELKARYKKDPGFFKLREDWWTANRETIWKAITCNAQGNTYFRATCDIDRGFSQATKQCRCDKDKGAKDGDQVPTYFDYVPQFLRWFEEWAEDFCRKRKHKLENAKTKCRGENDSGEPRYCSRNGYDCTKTIRGINKLVKSEDCTKCSVVCTPFVKWIDNKKQEFEKQKNKYADEIKKADGTKGTTIKTANGKTINNLYVSDFYKTLQDKYGSVDKFLQKLNDETTCKEHPEVEGKSHIDFNDDVKTTFSHKEYCETCPWCATKVKKQNEKWTDIPHESRCPNNVIKDLDDKNTTDIDLLVKDTSGTNIVEKLGSLCGSNANNEQYDIWKCYYDKNKEKSIGGGDKDYCVLQDGNKDKPELVTIRPYDVLFPNWINEMLKDSIDWSKELDRCINNKLGNCISKKCNRECGCFEKWVKRMKEEWQQLEKHYEKEDFGKVFTAYGTLELNLDLSYLPIIKEAHPKEKRVEEMQNIIDANKTKLTKLTKDDNAINSFLQQEEQEAEKCKQKQNECPKKPPKKAPEGAGDGAARSDPHQPSSPQTPDHSHSESDTVNDDDDEDEDDDVDFEDEEEEDDKHGGDQDDKDTEQEKEEKAKKEEPTTKDVVKPACDIVDELFKKPENLSDACTLKYVTGKNYGWRCVPTSGSKSDTTGSSGGLCIPPRRRKLYLHKVGNGGEDITDDKSLRDWFVKSAAVETFFAWHEFKMEKKKEKEEANEIVASETSDEAQNELESGKIPEEFKRQMFYTLGDYRDILFSGSNNNNIVLEASGNKEEKQKMQEIQKKIKEHINNGSKSAVTQPSGTTPQQTWWEANGEHIWHGMICALTYKDNGEKGKPPKHLQDVEKAFFGTQNGNPGSPVTNTGTTGTPTGTYQSTYNYKTVELKEDNENGAKSAGSLGTSGEKTTLDSFIKRPPYFRYLEEWGETFCKERKKRLEKIKGDCYKDGGRGEKQYSGDGEDCETILSDKYDTVPSLGYSCPKSCRFYKKWIERKKIEFTKQSGAYAEQKNKCVNGSNNHGNEFCGKQGKCETAGDFLEKLKNGPCKKDNDSEEDEIKFDIVSKTLKHTEYCDPCSQFKINCNGNDHCDTTKGEGCKNKSSIGASDIQNKADCKEVDMRVSDSNTTGFGDLKSSCEKAGIFEGIRKDVWTCGKVCGYNVCKPKKLNEKQNDEKHIITIRALVAHWVEYFLDDYNKIRKKLNPCINDGKEPKCIKTCDKKCNCVVQWIEKKKEEWKNLKNLYLDQYKNADESYPVKTILEDFESRPELNKAIKPCKDLDKFEESKECAVDANSQNGKPQKKDIVECLLNKLQQKATSCQSQHSDKTQQQCQDPTLDEEPLEEENTLDPPKICPEQPKEEAKEEGTCEKAVDPGGDEKTKGEQDGGPPAEPEQTPPLKPESPAIPAPATPRPQPTPTQLLDHPAVIPALMSSTIMWSIGIGFATFTYFYLKVLYIYVYMW